jgi:tetratricopeptide (TPR) repeat protein
MPVMAAEPAAAPPPSAAELARAHFERATNHYNLGQFEEAITEFRKAYEVKADPSFIFNIAQSYRHLGINDKAIFFYRRYLSMHPDPPDRAQVEERIRQLTALVRAREAAPPAPEPTAATTEAPVAVAPVSDSPPAPAPPPAAPPAALPPAEPPPGGASAIAATTITSVAPPPEPVPLWKRRWVWLAAGGVVLVGAALAIWATGPDKSAAPGSALGNMRFF